MYIVVSGDAWKIKDKLGRFGPLKVYDADGNLLNEK
jgi:hypothetical protein